MPDFPDRLAPIPTRMRPAMNERLAALKASGVSIWLDDLSRDRLDSGNLRELIEHYCVTGVTTNPSIFAAALGAGHGYRERITALGEASVDDAIWALMIDDVRDACDVLLDVFHDTDGIDGRVSIEVDPNFADDAAATVQMAEEIWRTVDRPNLLIKIPATAAGLEAITAVIARGISVNVTLIFSINRYREVLAAYAQGLRIAQTEGKDLSSIHSVASFFISRLDSDVDAHLVKIGRPELGGRAAVANARLAYQACAEFHDTDDWRSLAQAGANMQRPLWASTSVKNPHYDDTMYVSELVVPGSVNTMPESTLQAFADHGPEPRDRVSGNIREAQDLFAELGAIGIDYEDVVTRLEAEGVRKFMDSWAELKAIVEQEM